MAKFLIVYATEEGQTKKISEFMKNEITSLGHVVELYNCRDIYDLIISDDYDGVIVGGSFAQKPFSETSYKMGHR